ncbi:MAG TPA: hypothetical protein VL020_04675 [Pseudomonadales bacterium]|nr:hypothetical protein [Gammaproteobacteria bacterium]HUH57789.1 hypothetical protein [Pseudomonadales bacterium]
MRVVFLLAMFFTASVQAATPSFEYDTYYNARFGFKVSYPSELFVPTGESDNGDGQHFVERRGRALIIASGGHNLEPDIMCNLEQALLWEDDLNVTYRRQIGDSAFFSGTKGSNIIYRKLVRTDTVCLNLTLQYPIEDKAFYDDIVTKVVKSFTPIK